MCGLTGFWRQHGGLHEADATALTQRMADALRHRGPDDSGVWTDSEAGISLGHRRLAIIDLSPLGHQPMFSSDGRWVIVFNGEIYNYLILRDELQRLGADFRGHSDTEVILAGCSIWGVTATVRRLSGMFAIALWDRKERTLHLIRDRLGIKPLYWGKFGDLVVFGSELKAVVAHGGWTPEIDRDALAAYLQFGYVPAPRSIWQNVNKLRPGYILSIGLYASSETQYWSAEQVAKEGVAKRDIGKLSDGHALDQLNGLLGEVISQHMISDVPLGAFLSGGYDSTLVAAMMQRHSLRPVKTFSIGFEEAAYNEAHHARAVAEHLGTDHAELYVKSSAALAVLPKLPHLYDEPFSDSSQIPTYLISELTRRHVTVALSGDGGDELFTGYARYAQANRLWHVLNSIPGGLRQLLASAGHNVGNLVSLIGKVRTGDRLLSLAQLLRGGDTDLYSRFMNLWQNPADMVIGASESPSELWSDDLRRCMPALLDRMQYSDLITYLPDDILTKVDRATMAVGLEARVPLLDHRLVEFSWSLPMRMKMRNGESKWLLRQLLYRYVPKRLMDRPKMGFGVPIDEWLRGAMRDWCEDLLAEGRLRQEGYLKPERVRQCWSDHIEGRRPAHYKIWAILMFQAWLEHQKESRVIALH